MIRAVIDTNVIVSALINPGSKPGQIMKMVMDGQISPVVNNAIIKEYREVLGRKKFSFSEDEIKAFLLFMGRFVFEHRDIRNFHKGIPKDDAVFVLAAAAGGADYIITGNIRHFPDKKYGSCDVVNPSDFLEMLK